MLPNEARNGMKVMFGRPNGEQTLGEIIKLNPTKAKVKTLDSRGNGRGSTPGAIWTVPYSLMTPHDENVNSNDAPIVPAVVNQPLLYSPFQQREDQFILMAINQIYGNLSPENLFADGERSRSDAARLAAMYHKKLEHLFKAFGRTVSDDEVSKWVDQKEAAEKSRTPVKV